MIILKRKSDWEQSLYNYISSKRHEPFVYGSNDCCTFSLDAIVSITGVDIMSEFRGKYNSLTSSLRALREIGNGNVESTIDAKLPEIPVSSAKRGDLAFFDGSLGVIMGSFAWFVSDDGLERVPRSMWDKAWSVGHG